MKFLLNMKFLLKFWFDEVTMHFTITIFLFNNQEIMKKTNENFKNPY